MQLDGRDVVGLNLDVCDVVSNVLGRLPALQKMRAVAAEHLPKFDLASFDTLEDRAPALSGAHALWPTTVARPDRLRELYGEATTPRALLHANANALCVGSADG